MDNIDYKKIYEEVIFEKITIKNEYEQYKNLGLDEKLDGSYLSQILDNQLICLLT